MSTQAHGRTRENKSTNRQKPAARLMSFCLLSMAGECWTKRLGGGGLNVQPPPGGNRLGNHFSVRAGCGVGGVGGGATLSPLPGAGMSARTPAVTVALHVGALLRGESLPAPVSAEAELLRQAVRCMLASETYPRAAAADRNELALMVLQALSARMRADVVAARALGQAGTHE